LWLFPASVSLPRHPNNFLAWVFDFFSLYSYFSDGKEISFMPLRCTLATALHSNNYNSSFCHPFNACPYLTRVKTSVALAEHGGKPQLRHIIPPRVISPLNTTLIVETSPPFRRHVSVEAFSFTITAVSPTVCTDFERVLRFLFYGFGRFFLTGKVHLSVSISISSLRRIRRVY